jgi:hypothetical protein
VNDTPLIPGSLYGLRTWRLVSDAHGECLKATARTTRWPSDGTWMEATCETSEGHAAPHPDCACGIHAWHPRRASARRVLASRFEVPGVVEAAGAIELQDDGFRAQRARPYAFVVTPGRNTKLAERLARRYGARVVQVGGADALVAWCRERGLGLDEQTVGELLGPERVGERHAARRRRRRRDALRAAATVALIGALLIAGAALASGPPSPHGVYGRTGWVKPPTCPPRPATGADPPRQDPAAPTPPDC